MDTVPFKLVADWIITARCPLRCEHCIVGELVANAKERVGRELSTEECKQLIDFLHHNGTRVLSITGGEALTRPDLFEIVDYGRAKGMKVCLYTTGLTFINIRTAELKTEYVRKVLERVDFLGISIDTFHDDAYMQIRVTDYCQPLVRKLFTFAAQEFPQLQIQLFTVLGRRNGTASVNEVVSNCSFVAGIIETVSAEIGRPIRWRLSPFRFNPDSMLRFQRRLLFSAEETDEIIRELQERFDGLHSFTMHFGVDYESFFIYPDGKFRTVRLDENGIDRFVELGNFRERRMDHPEIWRELYEKDGQTARRMQRADLIRLHEKE